MKKGKNPEERQLGLLTRGNAVELPKFKRRVKLSKAGKVVVSRSDNSDGFFGNRIHKLLSTREASGLLGVSENALRILVCRKKIKAYKLGSRLKFRHRDLADCLQQKEV